MQPSTVELAAKAVDGLTENGWNSEADAVAILAGLQDDPTMPEFVLKGHDALAVPALIEYREECKRHGRHNQAVEVNKAIQEFVRWQEANIQLTRLPDH